MESWGWEMTESLGARLGVCLRPGGSGRRLKKWGGRVGENWKRGYCPGFFSRWRALAYVERNPVRAGMSRSAMDYPWSSAAARLGRTVAPAWLELAPWIQHWTPEEWLLLLGDESSDELIRLELQEATLTGCPLGAALVERLEKELGRRLRRGKAGRPPKQAVAQAQGSLFEGGE
jgi:REP-associated tyrosine transposase